MVSIRLSLLVCYKPELTSSYNRRVDWRAALEPDSRARRRACFVGPTGRGLGSAACLAYDFSVGCVLIIPMIIQTILLDPSGAVWTDGSSNVSRLDPSGAV
jgi:hypothetical protein